MASSDSAPAAQPDLATRLNALTKGSDPLSLAEGVFLFARPAKEKQEGLYALVNDLYGGDPVACVSGKLRVERTGEKEYAIIETPFPTRIDFVDEDVRAIYEKRYTFQLGEFSAIPYSGAEAPAESGKAKGTLRLYESKDFVTMSLDASKVFAKGVVDRWAKSLHDALDDL